MDIYIESNTITLTNALLIYRNGTGKSKYQPEGDVAYVSSHPITVKDGVPVIEAGKALTVDGLQSALASLATDKGISGLVWTDESTVATSIKTNVWWTPAQSRYMYFEAYGLEQGGRAQNPALVWIECGRSLYIFALKDNQKPTKDTELWNAPLFNVFEDGEVCMGTMETPKFGESKKWEESFYRATFTHANPGNRMLTTFKGGNNALWKHLMDHPRAKFPIKNLISAKKTLGSMVAFLESNK